MYVIILQVLALTGGTSTVHLMGPMSPTQCHEATAGKHAAPMDANHFAAVGCTDIVGAQGTLANCVQAGPEVGLPGMPTARDSFWVCGR